MLQGRGRWLVAHLAAVVATAVVAVGLVVPATPAAADSPAKPPTPASASSSSPPPAVTTTTTTIARLVAPPPTTPHTTPTVAPPVLGPTAPSSGTPLGPPAPNTGGAAAGPIDPSLVTSPATSGLVGVLDDLAAQQRALSARVTALEVALGVPTDVGAAGATTTSGAPTSTAAAVDGRVDQMILQEQQLTSLLDSTRADLAQLPTSAPPTTSTTPPSATDTPKAASGATPPGAVVTTTAEIGAASIGGSSLLGSGSGLLPRNPAMVGACSPTLLAAPCVSTPAAPSASSDIITQTAVTFLSDVASQRAQLTQQLKQASEDYEEAHLRAVTNAPESGATTVPAASGAVPAGAIVTAAGTPVTGPSAATSSIPAHPTFADLDSARQQLADLTQQLNTVADAHALTTSAQGAAQPSALAKSDIPPSYLALYERAAATCAGLSWTVLAAIGSIESNHGRSTLPGVSSGANYAGAMGPMQFLASSWAAFAVDANGDGVANVYTPADAIFGAARYLCHDGAGNPATLRSAVFSYNHADWYVDRVLDLAIRYGTGGLAPVTATAADVLRNPNITMTADAAADLRSGTIDPRVIDVLQAAAATHHITISVIKTGHTQYVAGTDNVSDHFYGRGVDIAAVDGANVSATNYAALDLALAILTSSPPLRPDEFGSPWLELTSFPGAFTDANHTDHLHIGWDG